ncbi:hypothetical protein PoB_000154200 [Plakobranchus ocellatus]|uniref:Uncharacterized protein n=1 Tax=Plakobranchus ocellatus TaxID=259542 RepID=A0AAV3XYW3_9GAST|nr:hypothetical protein PoB_000154200 [Plakobranchus ocellatus]
MASSWKRPDTAQQSPSCTSFDEVHSDLRLSGPPSGQGTGSGARTRRIPADLRADSQATVLPTPPSDNEKTPVY